MLATLTSISVSRDADRSAFQERSEKRFASRLTLASIFVVVLNAFRYPQSTSRAEIAENADRGIALSEIQ